jgi:enoyl-CoA hydratase/carnithine racemase
MAVTSSNEFYMGYQHLKFDVAGEVATVWLDRPPTNLLNIEMVEELNDALSSLRGKRAVEVLVIRGSRDVFSEGFDLEELVPGRVQRMLHVYMRLYESMRLMDVIEVAAVEGRALGAGLEVALGCNLFVAAENANFAFPETGYGFFPPIATGILPRIAPRRKAMEWILTGNGITAGELHHHGVINRLLPPDNFDQALDAFVSEMASKSGPVLALAKRAQFEAYYSTFPEAMSRATSLFLRELQDLQDSAEGLAAFREKREPRWKNS